MMNTSIKKVLDSLSSITPCRTTCGNTTISRIGLLTCFKSPSKLEATIGWLE